MGISLLCFLPLAFSLKLFIVPHSHCDTGWVKTIDEYYDLKVQHILNNTVKILSENPTYKIVWAETSYLKQWMENQAADNQLKMKALIRAGQVDIVGGGFVQNDEANPDFEAVIRQIETGHQYLKDAFGLSRIKVGWQIDPFGHSALTPTILKKFGYEYLVINRVGSLVKVSLTQDSLIDNKNLEFVWKATDLGKTGGIFTHVLHTHYDPPVELNLQQSYCMQEDFDVSYW